MKLKKWEIALFISVCILMLSGFKVDRDVTALSDKLIRLHVVANSDSEEDQAVKLKVRDAVLEMLDPMLDGECGKDGAEDVISGHMDDIVAAAEKTLHENGYSYEVSAKLAAESFPTVDYDTFSLPAGEYTSLRIVIGEGEGHNWWCVVFPSLCTAAAVEYDDDTTLTDAETALITRENPHYIIKFKIAEIIGSLKQLFVNGQ